MGVYGGPERIFSTQSAAGRSLYSPGVVQNGLVLNLDAGKFYSYPQSGITWTDLTNNNNTGTLTNGPNYSSANSGSIVFDGTNDGIQLAGTNLSLNEHTISSWHYSTNFNQTGMVFEKSTNGTANTQYMITYNNNNFMYYRTIGLSTQDLVVANASTNNQWNNLVATFDGANKRIYTNGVLRGTSVTLTGTIVQNTTGIAAIGIIPDFVNYAFNGRIAITSIYNRALSAAEVSQNFNALRARFGI